MGGGGFSCGSNGLNASQVLPVSTQDRSRLLVCRRGQAGDKLWNAAAAPCNFSGYRESAVAWLTLDCPSPSLRACVCGGRELSATSVLWECSFLLIELEGLLNVAWFLQPAIMPTEIQLYSISPKDPQYRPCSAQARFWSECSPLAVLIWDVLFPVFICLLIYLFVP